MSASRTESLFVLRLGETLFAIDAHVICQVLDDVVATPVPLAPPPILGVAPFRGRILTIVSLQHLLALDGPRHSPFIIVIEDRVLGERIGLTADAVEGVFALSSDTAQTIPHIADNSARHLFDCLYRTEIGAVVRLRTDRIIPEYLSQATRRAASDESPDC